MFGNGKAKVNKDFNLKGQVGAGYKSCCDHFNISSKQSVISVFEYIRDYGDPKRDRLWIELKNS